MRAHIQKKRLDKEDEHTYTMEKRVSPLNTILLFFLLFLNLPLVITIYMKSNCVLTKKFVLFSFLVFFSCDFHTFFRHIHYGKKGVAIEHDSSLLSTFFKLAVSDYYIYEVELCTYKKVRLVLFPCFFFLRLSHFFPSRFIYKYQQK